MKRRHFTRILAGAALASSARAAAEATPWSRAEPHMGCLWTLTLPGTPPAAAGPAAAAVFAEIARLNRIFSDYEPTSELNQLCAKAGSFTPIPVSGELFDILERSSKMSALTGGLFDITLAPCVRLWRRSRRRNELPSPDALAKALALRSSEDLLLDPAARTVRLAKPGMQLDLGGIAKGWTQDACLALLRDRFKITCVLLDAAGEVAAGTPPAGRETWQIGLQPSGSEAAVRIFLKNANVATSGDHYQFVEIDGLRYSHIIDPRTGLGSTVSRQASLIAPTGALADPLTKMLCLMDPAESLPILAKNWPGLHARVTTQRPGEALVVKETPDFPALLANE
jgi:thiamine biosynthesis lipoprotein